MKLFIDKSLPIIEALFNEEFYELIFFDKQTQCLTEDVDVIICRAHTKIDANFLNGFETKLVASATSGTDHLDKHYLKQHNIHWVDAVGSNAKSVSDYVIHLLHHPKIKITGKTVGIIGVGHVGSNLNNDLNALGFNTVLYDPPRAILDSQFKSCKLEALFQCDVISLHVPLYTAGENSTYQMINKDFLNQCQTDCLIINTSRGEVLNEQDVLTNTSLHFCLDVYCNEPEIRPELIHKCLVSTPHIAGHAIEAKQRSMVILHQKINIYLGKTFNNHIFNHLLSSPKALSQQKLNFSYDPFLETNALKSAPFKSTFQLLRQNHTYRHEL